MAKTRKNVTFNDFWIMGKWSQNKDAAWQVMRVLTSVEGTKGYSLDLAPRRRFATPSTPG